MEGGVSSNDIMSCVIKYLSKVDEKFEEVVLISDGCCFQNRNKIVESALNRRVQRKHSDQNFKYHVREELCRITSNIFKRSEARER